MPHSVNVAVVGFGFASQTFHVPLIQATPGLQLVAVSSSDADKLSAALPDVAVVATPQALLAHDDVELVVIPTPNETHFPLAKAALAAGKHVVLDKPFTVTLAEARQLKSLADHARRRLSVFHNRRWDSDFLTLKALLASGELGRVVSLESRFDRFRPKVRDRWREKPRPGGGIWYDLGPHLLDQACELFGMPRAIQLNLARQRDHASIEDDFLCLLDYPGCRVSLAASALVAADTPRYRVNGTRGSYVKYGLDPQEARLKAGETPAPGWGVDACDGRLSLVDDATGEIRETRHPSHAGDYLAYYRGVADALSGDGEMPVSVEDAIRSMRLLEAGLDSHRQGRWVSL